MLNRDINIAYLSGLLSGVIELTPVMHSILNDNQHGSTV